MNDRVKKLCLSALFLAMGLALTFLCRFFGPGLELIALPMHIPVLLCSLVCGASYGFLLGVLLPLFVNILSGYPIFVPTTIALCLELSIYGLLMSMIYKKISIYPALILTILLGRAISGMIYLLVLEFEQQEVTIAIFLSIAYISVLPGLLLQLLLVPVLIHTVVHIKQTPKKIR